MALMTALHLFLKACREIHYSITLLASHHVAGLIHAGGIILYPHVGTGVKVAREAPAQLGAVIVDHYHCLVAHHLGIIDEGVQWRIHNGKQDKEDYHRLVAPDEVEFQPHHPAHLSQPSYFFFLILHALS